MDVGFCILILTTVAEQLKLFPFTFLIGNFVI